jgi:hypothetical protein
MLLPTSADLLRCIERTLETVIAPTLTGSQERSAAATIGHLLRHVALRIEHEGQMLFNDIGILRPLLLQVDAYLGRRPADDARAARVRAKIAAALAYPVSSIDYRDVASLAGEVSALRQGVCDALAFVQTQKSDAAGAAAPVHEALKRYVAWEIEQEAQLIDPAFEGFGPRR